MMRHTLTKLVFALSLAAGATLLPTGSAHALDKLEGLKGNPILRAHMRHVKRGRHQHMGDKPFTPTRAALHAPELDPASAGSMVGLLLAVGFVMRSRRRDDALAPSVG